MVVAEAAEHRTSAKATELEGARRAAEADEIGPDVDGDGSADDRRGVDLTDSRRTDADRS